MPKQIEDPREELARAYIRDNYDQNEIEIDGDEPARIGPDGVWVRAWVFVSNEGVANYESEG